MGPDCDNAGREHFEFAGPFSHIRMLACQRLVACDVHAG